MLRSTCALLTFIIVGSLSSTATASNCTPDHIADIPLHNDGLFLNAPVVLDGRQARFILDTGSEGSLIIPEAAAALHLTPDPTHATVIQGPNGRGQLAPNMLIRALSIGSIPLGQRSIPLGALPGLPILTPPSRVLWVWICSGISISNSTFLIDVSFCGGQPCMTRNVLPYLPGQRAIRP